MVETLLWRGAVDAAIDEFKDWQHERIDTFIAYLNKHRHRIVNYSYFQAEGISIASGTIESTVKQIGHESNSQAHSGKQKMFLKFFYTAAPISMDSSQFEICKTGMHPLMPWCNKKYTKPKSEFYKMLSRGIARN